MLKRVVITGCGVVSPLGSDIETFWQNIQASKSGISRLADDELIGVKSRVAGKVQGYNQSDYFENNNAKKCDLFVQYGIAAADQAVRNSGITQSEIDINPYRYGVSIGAGIGGLDSIEKNYQKCLDKGANRISPHFVPATIINMVAGNVSMRHGCMGPNLSIVTACASGTHNIGMAYQLIASGQADVMLAGGAEYSSVMLAMGGFASMKALSTNPDPNTASRPFDKDRDGFVLSDGAGIVVLEEYEKAKKRNAPIIAEIIGFGMTSDAHHVTQPAPNGLGAIVAMQQAISLAGCQLSDIGYINAHGTSTYHDKTEANAISELFVKHNDDLLVSSTKSMLGHQLGAAGASEAIICALSLQQQVVPASINCVNQDPEIKLKLVKNNMQDHTYKYTVSNSFGFGGTNAAIVLAKI